MKSKRLFDEIPHFLRRGLWILEELNCEASGYGQKRSFRLKFRKNTVIPHQFNLFLGDYWASNNRVFRILRKGRPLFQCGLSHVTEMTIKGELASICLTCHAEEGELPGKIEIKFLIKNHFHRTEFLQMREALMGKEVPIKLS